MSGSSRSSFIEDVKENEASTEISGWCAPLLPGWVGEAADIKRFENISLDLPPGFLFAAEEDTSRTRLHFDSRRRELQAMVADMTRTAPSWDGEPTRVSPGAATTAMTFLQALPSNRHLPQVSADGEGDIMFVWRPPAGDCVLTVEDGLLHLVVHPGLPSVEHIDSVPFQGGHIPINLLRHLPIK